MSKILILEDRPSRQRLFLPNREKDIETLLSISGLSIPLVVDCKKIIDEINNERKEMKYVEMKEYLDSEYNNIIDDSIIKIQEPLERLFAQELMRLKNNLISGLLYWFDEEAKAGYYYNYKTGETSWTKPEYEPKISINKNPEGENISLEYIQSDIDLIVKNILNFIKKPEGLNSLINGITDQTKSVIKSIKKQGELNSLINGITDQTKSVTNSIKKQGELNSLINGITDQTKSVIKSINEYHSVDSVIQKASERKNLKSINSINENIKEHTNSVIKSIQKAAEEEAAVRTINDNVKITTDAVINSIEEEEAALIKAEQENAEAALRADRMIKRSEEAARIQAAEEEARNKKTGDKSEYDELENNRSKNNESEDDKSEDDGSEDDGSEYDESAYDSPLSSPVRDNLFVNNSPPINKLYDDFKKVPIEEQIKGLEDFKQKFKQNGGDVNDFTDITEYLNNLTIYKELLDKANIPLKQRVQQYNAKMHKEKSAFMDHTKEDTKKK